MEQRRRLLILDDEQLLVRSFSRILGRDFDVTALTSAKDALRRAAAGESWDFILCDLQMPEVDGVAFYEELSRTRPMLSSRVAFVTGGAVTERVISFLERTTRPTIEKPMAPEDLRALVASMIT